MVGHLRNAQIQKCQRNHNGCEDGCKEEALFFARVSKISHVFLLRVKTDLSILARLWKEAGTALLDALHSCLILSPHERTFLSIIVSITSILAFIQVYFRERYYGVCD